MNQAPFNKNRQDKFILVLNLPEGIKQIVDNITRNSNRIDANALEISITGTVTPTISIPEKTLPYGAQSIKVSSHAREPYSSLDINFKIDNEADPEEEDMAEDQMRDLNNKVLPQMKKIQQVALQGSLNTSILPEETKNNLLDKTERITSLLGRTT